jgi:pilus assembly protein CpaF
VSADQQLVRQIHRTVGERMQDASTNGASAWTAADERQYARHLITQALTEYAIDQATRGAEPLEADREQELAAAVYARLYGAGRLQPLLDDESIENIDINGPTDVWVTYNDARRVRLDPVADSDEELVEILQVLASYAGLNARPFDAANPELDLRLPDGSRLSAVMSATAHPCVSIRRHRFLDVTVEDLVANKTMSQEVADFLTAAVRAQCNIVIGGGTNAGKTTLLRALIRETDPADRLVTVEKTLELALSLNKAAHANIVEFEERRPNSEGQGAITMAGLVRRSLRMNPDRIIVGEVLGGEIVVMLNAMSQGNDGSLSTIHAKDAHGVFDRIASYAAQSDERLDFAVTHQLIAGALDLVVYVKKDKAQARFVHEIVEVNGHDGQRVAASRLFGPGDDGRAVRNPDVAVSETLRDKLLDAGWRGDEAWWDR